MGRQKRWQIGEESGDGRGDRRGSRYHHISSHLHAQIDTHTHAEDT